MTTETEAVALIVKESDLLVNALQSYTSCLDDRHEGDNRLLNRLFDLMDAIKTLDTKASVGQ